MRSDAESLPTGGPKKLPDKAADKHARQGRRKTGSLQNCAAHSTDNFAARFADNCASNFDSTTRGIGRPFQPNCPFVRTRTVRVDSVNKDTIADADAEVAKGRPDASLMFLSLTCRSSVFPLRRTCLRRHCPSTCLTRDTRLLWMIFFHFTGFISLW